MQGIWRKVGAALTSGLLIGATLAGAALAQGKDLGDYKDLVVAEDGSVTGLFVVGADAATADVVSAIGMAAWVGNQQAGSGAATEGQITLTSQKSSVKGVTRHVPFDGNASFSYEFGSTTTTEDIIGPSGFASGDGIVDFLYSHKDKGPIYVNGTEYQWHEAANLSLTGINLTRDTLQSSVGDQYDEIYLKIGANSMHYAFVMDKTLSVANVNWQGKKIWFLGKEYTVISSSSTKYKLGASDAEVVLTTENPTTTVGGVDVTLGGIFAVGTSGTYKAKITLTNGGTTETKYVSSGDTDTVAGIEVYVKNAVVTTSGTNLGEAQMVVGAGILKLTDGDLLKRGDGTESTWTTTLELSATALVQIKLTQTQAYSSVGGSFDALKLGKEILAPNDQFSLKLNALTDKSGNPVKYRKITLQPDTRFATKSVRIKTTDGDYLYYNGSFVTSEIFANFSLNTSNTFFYRDTSAEPVAQKAISAPKIRLATGQEINITTTIATGTGAAGPGSMGGWVSFEEPTLEATNTNLGGKENLTVMYATKSDSFDDVSTTGVDFRSAGVYVYYGDANATAATNDTMWIGRNTNVSTSATRDFWTRYGFIVEAPSNYVVTFKAPEGQTFGEVVFGSVNPVGKSVTAAPGDIVDIDGTSLKVEGSVSGGSPVSLPASMAKLDSEVTSADKSAYTLVLVGGPKINTLVNELQTAVKLEKTIGSPGDPDADVAAKGAGVVQLVEDAWGTGKYAVVVAGSDRAGTATAAGWLADFDANVGVLDGQTAYTG